MRSTWLTLLATLLLGSSVYAQAQTTQTSTGAQAPRGAQTAEAAVTPPPNPDPTGAKLNSLLLRWEQEMQNIQTAAAQCSRTEVNKTYLTTTTFEGVLKFMKPNLAVVDMRKKNKPEVFEKYVFTGTYLYEYVLDKKEIRVHELGNAGKGNGQNENQMSLLLGMKAETARARYDLKLLKEDQWYYYVEIMPRTPADKADFQRARMVLTKDRYLPRQLWFEEVNGNEITWEMPRIETGVVLQRTEFTQPTPPAGWNLVRDTRANATAPRNDVPPRIVRPAQ